MSTEAEKYAFQLEWLQRIAGDLETLHKLPQVAYRIKQARAGLEVQIEALCKLLIDLCGKDNHLSHCDRLMGATHPCTCGTRRAYRLIHGMSVDEEVITTVTATAALGTNLVGEPSVSPAEDSRSRELPPCSCPVQPRTGALVCMGHAERGYGVRCRKNAT